MIRYETLPDGRVVLFKTIGAQENELRKRLSKLFVEEREVKKALSAITRTKLILLKVDL